MQNIIFKKKQYTCRNFITRFKVNSDVIFCYCFSLDSFYCSFPSSFYYYLTTDSNFLVENLLGNNRTKRGDHD